MTVLVTVTIVTTQDREVIMNPNDYVVIDIETYPNMDMVDKLPEPKIDSRLKDPAKIEKAKTEATQKQIDEMALNPLYGKIACIGSSLGTLNKGLEETTVWIDQSEDEIIKRFFGEIATFKNGNSPKIVTWNGLNFDIPFIYKRALLLGVKPTMSMSFWMKKYTTAPHCDLMQVWCNWYGYEKLDNVTQALLNEGKEEFDVKEISDLMKTEEGKAKITRYCSNDVAITNKLFHKMANVLF